MNFLVRYFERSVKATGNESLIQEMNDKISKWESRLEYTAKEGIAMASKEAVAEEASVETPKVEEVNVEVVNTAKAIRKEAYECAAHLRKSIKKNPSKSNKKELADLEAFIAEFKTMTDLELISKTQELQTTYK